MGTPLTETDVVVLEANLLDRVGSASDSAMFLEYTIHDLAHWLDYRQPIKDLPPNLNDTMSSWLESTSLNDDLPHGSYGEPDLSRSPTGRPARSPSRI